MTEGIQTELYIISEEMLQQEVYNGRIPLSVAETIRSRPLSSALKAERKTIYKLISAERDPSLEYVDWDSIEAIFIRLQGEQQ